MAKFMVLSLFVILTLQQWVEGMDMGRCAQLAIAKGVPSLGIPTHDPLVISRNISSNLKKIFPVFQNITVELNEITWTNLPWWKIMKNTVTKNTSEVLAIEGELWWDNFTISLNYLTESENETFSGELKYSLEDISWIGEWEETKPDNEGIRVVNHMNVKQRVGKKSVTITGLGAFDFIADTLLTLLFDFFNDAVVNTQNGIGIAMAYKINTIWYSLEDISWIGEWEETKPDKEGIRVVNHMNVEQRVGKKSVTITGLGAFDFIADTLLTLLFDFFNDAVVNTQNAIGIAMAYKINTIWYGRPIAYNKLSRWCELQNL